MLEESSVLDEGEIIAFTTMVVIMLTCGMLTIVMENAMIIVLEVLIFYVLDMLLLFLK